MYSEMLEGDRIAEIALHNPQLVKGIAASLRTLIISSFRAPSTQFVMALLKVSASSGASGGASGCISGGISVIDNDKHVISYPVLSCPDLT